MSIKPVQRISVNWHNANFFNARDGGWLTFEEHERFVAETELEATKKRTNDIEKDNELLNNLSKEIKGLEGSMDRLIKRIAELEAELRLRR